MTRIAIVTDSTTSLPQELVERYHIHVIPTLVLFGMDVYRDGVDLSPPQFYRMLGEASHLPTTSQPSMEDFADFYRSLGEEADAIISIHVSEELSGTLASAYAARTTLPGVPIEIIDSRFISMGLGFVVLAAARAAAEGKSVAEAAMAAKEVVPKMNLLFVVETLRYLAKGGRIGGASALIGSVLQIKPVLCIKDGRIEVQEKVRSTIKARGRMIEIMEERVGPGATVHAAVVHANSLAEAEAMREELARRFNCAELYVTEIGAVIGTHTGPGTVGVAFYAEE